MRFPGPRRCHPQYLNLPVLAFFGQDPRPTFPPPQGGEIFAWLLLCPESSGRGGSLCTFPPAGPIPIPIPTPAQPPRRQAAPSHSGRSFANWILQSLPPPGKHKSVPGKVARRGDNSEPDSNGKIKAGQRSVATGSIKTNTIACCSLEFFSPLPSRKGIMQSCCRAPRAAP